MNAILSKEDLTSAREALRPLIFTKEGKMRSKCPHALFALYTFLNTSNEDKYASVNAKPCEFTHHRCSWEFPSQLINPMDEIFIKDKHTPWGPHKVLSQIGYDYEYHCIVPVTSNNPAKALKVPPSIAKTLCDYWKQEHPMYEYTIKTNYIENNK